jgi:hypothetical protein
VSAGVPARRLVCGTNLGDASFGQRLWLVNQIGGRIDCSQRHYSRCGRLYRSLSIDDIPLEPG